MCAAPLKTVLSLWDFLLLTRLPDDQRRICADIKEDDLTKKIQDSLNSGAVYLLDAQGNILFQSGNNSHFPVSVSDELTGQILQAAKDADTRSVVIPNREYLVVGRTLNRSGWCIAV